MSKPYNTSFKTLIVSRKHINILANNSAAISGGSVPVSFNKEQLKALIHPDFVQVKGELLEIIFNSPIQFN
jgi:hypothetical protein